MTQIVVIAVVLVFVYAALSHFKPGIALLTMPFVVVVLGWAALEIESVVLLLLAVTLLLVSLGIVSAARREVEAELWARLLATWVLIVVVLILFFVAAIACFACIGAGFFLPLFFFLGLAAIIAGLIGYGVLGRRAAMALVFSTLGASMRQNLPLPMALDCAAAGRSDAGARALRRIKKWLLQGYSLVESVGRGYPRCPARFLAMLAAAELVGQLPTAIVAIEADMRSQDIERHRFRPVHPIYPVIILSIAFLIVLALMTFVVPQYKAVLEEMGGSRLPAATRVLIAVMDVLRNNVLFWMALTLVLLGGLFMGVYGRFLRRRPDKPRWLSWVGDSIKWYLPALHWFQNNGSLLQVTELLRLALNAGNTVNEAIRATLQLDVNLHFRRRLKCWLTRVERGEAIAAAARRCGLGSVLAWAFDANTGN